MKRSENRNKRIHWVCKCECGEETITSGTNLRTGVTKSCGCLRVDTLRERVIDITNKRVGRLTIIETVENDARGKTQWLCQCDCGNKTTVRGSDLHEKRTRSCGCYHKDVMSKTMKNYNRKSNVFYEEGDYIVGLTSKNERFLIDKDDLDTVMWHCWSIDSYGYLAAVANRKSLLIHRLIMDAPPDKMVDHINHDICDNRKANLRLVSNSQNQMNSRTPSNNTSGVKGVCWHKVLEKWKASITVRGRVIHLGYYDSIQDATIARELAELNYFKEYNYEEDVKFIV